MGISRIFESPANQFLNLNEYLQRDLRYGKHGHHQPQTLPHAALRFKQLLRCHLKPVVVLALCNNYDAASAPRSEPLMMVAAPHQASPTRRTTLLGFRVRLLISSSHSSAIWVVLKIIGYRLYYGTY